MYIKFKIKDFLNELSLEEKAMFSYIINIKDTEQLSIIDDNSYSVNKDFIKFKDETNELFWEESITKSLKNYDNNYSIYEDLMEYGFSSNAKLEELIEDFGIKYAETFTNFIIFIKKMYTKRYANSLARTHLPFNKLVYLLILDSMVNSKTDIQEKTKLFNILASEDKPILHTLYIFNTIAEIKETNDELKQVDIKDPTTRLLNSFLSERIDAPVLEYINVVENDQVTYLCSIADDIYTKSLEKKYNELKNNYSSDGLLKKDKIIEKQKNIISNLKIINKENISELKMKKKEMNQLEINLKERIKLEKAQLSNELEIQHSTNQQLKNKIKSLESTIIKERKEQEKLLKQYKTQHMELLKEEEQLNKQLLELQRASQIPLDISVDTVSLKQWMSIGNYYFESNKQEVLDYFDSLKLQNKPATKADNVKLVEGHKTNYSFYIGYTAIEEDKHFVVLPDGSKHELLKLPDTLFLKPYQFIKVTSKYEFLKYYKEHYDESITHSDLYGFGVTLNSSTDNNSPVRYRKTDGTIGSLKGIPQNIKLRENQVIAYDSKGRFIRYYLYEFHDLDMIEPSISAKGMHTYILLKQLSGGCVVKDLQTNTEIFVSLDLSNENLEQYSTLIMKGEEVVTIFKSTQFYKKSSYYDKSETVVVDSQQGSDYFIRKFNGECVLLKNIPERLSINIGDVVRVDEDNNFIESIRYSYQEKHISVEQRKLISKLSNSIKEKSKKTDVKKRVLIVGNPGMSLTYEFNLAKLGYSTTTVDGYANYNEINSLYKNIDVVVIITKFISHSNMWKIKDSNITQPIIYAEKDGASYLGGLLDDTFVKNS